MDSTPHHPWAPPVWFLTLQEVTGETSALRSPWPCVLELLGPGRALAACVSQALALLASPQVTPARASGPSPGGAPQSPRSTGSCRMTGTLSSGASVFPENVRGKKHTQFYVNKHRHI